MSNRLVFSPLTNRRGIQLKDYKDPVIIRSSGRGDFKITPKVAKELEVEDGSAMVVVELGGQIYVARGMDGKPIMNDDGEQVTDARGRRQFEKDSLYGVLLTPTSEGSRLLKLTATKAWEMLESVKDGEGNEVDTENNVVSFTLGKGVEGTIPEDKTGIKGYAHEATFYPLEYHSHRLKRGAGSSEDEDEDEVTVSDNVEVESVDVTEELI